MPVIKKKYPAFFFLLILFNIELIYAGPPFDTDDPEPVKFKHWEYYISSINNNQSNVWSGTAPHFEMNYGLIKNVQVHLLLPINYNYTRHEGSSFGFADTEVGLKYRFIRETDNSPQVGVFPIFEIPTIKNSGFSNGKTKVYLPVWLQKSWTKLTTYGGAGYWINPRTDNKNWIFTGWEVQYDFSETITLGGELYFHTADNKNTTSETGFNLGGSINASEKFHFIFSLGHTITGDNIFTSYFGLLWTI